MENKTTTIPVRRIKTANGFIYEVTLGKFLAYFVGDDKGCPKKSATPETWNKEVVGRTVEEITRNDNYAIWELAADVGKCIAYCIRQNRQMMPRIFAGMESFEEVVRIAELSHRIFISGKKIQDKKSEIEKLQVKINDIKENILAIQTEADEVEAEMLMTKEKVTELCSEINKKPIERPATEAIGDILDPKKVEELKNSVKPESKSGNGGQKPAVS